MTCHLSLQAWQRITFHEILNFKTERVTQLQVEILRIYIEIRIKSVKHSENFGTVVKYCSINSMDEKWEIEYLITH